MLNKDRIFILSFVLCSCYNQSDKPNNSLQEIEFLISHQDRQLESVNSEIDEIISSGILVSDAFLDSITTFAEVREKFEPLLSMVNKYSRSLNVELLDSIQEEYDRLLDYCVIHGRSKILSGSIRRTIDFFKESSNVELKRLMVKEFYNNILVQKLNMLEFKYDSILFECHDSLLKYELQPYSSDFIITSHSGSLKDN